MQPPGTWFASWMTRSKNPSENDSGSFSLRTCYVLHGMLVMAHIVLIVSYIYGWEHHVTLPFTPRNTDFWSVVLSASLQAFYMLYTAVLVFLTQRLAMSRILGHHLKLTSIHDISGAWSGLGSALSSVWKQSVIPASVWATTAVTAYLVCISVLHVTSSTLLQFQTFNSTMTTQVSTTIGWVDVSNPNVNWVDINWGAVTASLPAISQFPGIVAPGLSNNTVYDTLQTGSVVGHVSVNATTVTSSCGLLPNITYYPNNNTANAPFGNGNILILTVPPLSIDQIQVVPFSSFALYNPQSFTLPSVLLMVSTLLESIEPSVQKEVAVPMMWESPVANQSIDVYFMQCSLSTSNTTVPSTKWKEVHQWTSTEWSIYIGQILANWGSSSYQLIDNIYMDKTSILEQYIMSLAGLSLSSQYIQWTSSGPSISNSTFALRPDQLEAAIAQTVAHLTWMAGRIGSVVGIQPGEGMAIANEEVTALRLNITLLPLLFATSASVIMLGLTLHMTRAFHASHDIQASVSNTGVLQLLWLGCYSPSVREALQDVEHPTEDNLRRAGMMDVCFASTTSDEELPMRSVIDNSLSI